MNHVRLSLGCSKYEKDNGDTVSLSLSRSLYKAGIISRFYWLLADYIIMETGFISTPRRCLTTPTGQQLPPPSGERPRPFLLQYTVTRQSPWQTQLSSLVKIILKIKQWRITLLNAGGRYLPNGSSLWTITKYNATNGEWENVGKMGTARNYHSVELLDVCP